MPDRTIKIELWDNVLVQIFSCFVVVWAGAGLIMIMNSGSIVVEIFAIPASALVVAAVITYVVRSWNARIVFGSESVTLVRTFRTDHLPYEKCGSVAISQGFLTWHLTCIAIRTVEGRKIRSGLRSPWTTEKPALGSPSFRHAFNAVSSELVLRKEQLGLH